MTELLPWAWLVALAVLVGLGVLRDRHLGHLADRIETQLKRLEEERSSMTAWFQGTATRLEIAEKNARDALLKHSELSGHVASLNAWRDTHTHRIHGHKPLTTEDT